MNINGIASQSAALYASNHGADGVQRAASDLQGSGQPQEPELASGQETNPGLNETTVDKTAAGAATQVVQEATEALGLNIDTRA